MSYLLAIETSGKYGSVALASEDPAHEGEFPHIDLPRTIGSAQSLVPSIHRLLSDQRVTVEKIGCVALVNGPGSFTGLRVGIATAKSFAYAMGIPVVGLDTLEVMHLQASILLPAHHSTESILHTHTLLDAYRGQLFVRSKNSIGRQSESTVQDLTEFLDHCRALEQEPSRHMMIGPGVERLNRFLERELENEKLRDWVRQIPRYDDRAWEPHAKFVAKLGLERWAQKLTIDPIALLPNYFRGSAAEEKAKAV